MPKVLCAAFVLAIPLLLGAAGSSESGFIQGVGDFDSVEIRVLPVQGNVYMLVGTGSNITAHVGDDGVLLVDTQFAALSDKVLTAIRRLSEEPIRHIINTHAHPDHTGGNQDLADSGQSLGVRDGLTTRAQIIAHWNVLDRLVEGNTPFQMWPDSTFLTPDKELFFNGEGIKIFHQPAAHTDGDVIVFFRRSDVISTGDIFIKTNYPIIDLQSGGSINGIIDALNRVIDMTITEKNGEGGTLVIPGHGRISDQADVVDYRDMVTIVRDRISDMISKGMAVEEVKAAHPTLDYDPLYGSETGFWTTDMFVEAVYQSLLQPGN